ncbi:ribonuclease HII [Syntrophothermus sp.]|uniref:ribonuclease HII n=1 Tax=Syntrophothermus sp. TaxID=2736299 RepID=UPI00258095CF|nr:ribonuclease HII [Syntrophothermus sp.]
MVSDDERKRLQHMKEYEYGLYAKGIRLVAGTDEVGRGPIAGPVVAAAVILPPDFEVPGVNDSKQVPSKKREWLSDKIKEKALTWAVGILFPPYLDRINILNATWEAMRLALGGLSIPPEHVIVDGWPIPELGVTQTPLVKGDSLSISVACASILAKVERDRIMTALDEVYPGYGFARHKGYATREHLRALEVKGPCPIHRTSFEPIKSMVMKEDAHQGRLFD